MVLVFKDENANKANNDNLDEEVAFDGDDEDEDEATTNGGDDVNDSDGANTNGKDDDDDCDNDFLSKKPSGSDHNWSGYESHDEDEGFITVSEEDSTIVKVAKGL